MQHTTSHEQKGVSQMEDGTDLVKRLRHFGKSLPPENDNTHRYEAELTLRAADHIEKLEATIAACKEAGFVDENGNVRKVLGTLPVLASGEIVVSFEECVFAVSEHGIVECDVALGKRPTAGWVKPHPTQNVWIEYDIGKCYSTPEAAEKARRDEEAK